MSRTVEKITEDVWAMAFPGWTKEAYTAYLNSPANQSADSIFKQATRLRRAIRRHLAKHRLTDAEVIAAAGVEVPPRLEQVGGNKAEFARFHMRGFLYVLSEFLLSVEDFIPEPDDVSDDAGFLIPVPDAEYAADRKAVKA